MRVNVGEVVVVIATILLGLCVVALLIQCSGVCSRESRLKRMGDEQDKVFPMSRTSSVAQPAESANRTPGEKKDAGVHGSSASPEARSSRRGPSSLPRSAPQADLPDEHFMPPSPGSQPRPPECPPIELPGTVPAVPDRKVGRGSTWHGRDDSKELRLSAVRASTRTDWRLPPSPRSSGLRRSGVSAVQRGPPTALEKWGPLPTRDAHGEPHEHGRRSHSSGRTSHFDAQGRRVMRVSTETSLPRGAPINGHGRQERSLDSRRSRQRFAPDEAVFSKELSMVNEVKPQRSSCTADTAHTVV